MSEELEFTLPELQEGEVVDVPEILPLMAIRDIVLFPSMVVPLFVGRPQSLKAIEEALANEKLIVLATQKISRIENPKPSDLYPIGTLALILKTLPLSENRLKVVVQVLSRVEIQEFLQTEPFFKVRAIPCKEEERKIFCNVVDQPDVSSFIVPSVVKRGALTLAISTSGASPAVSRRLRERLERLFGEEYASYLELMRRIRESILSKGLPQEEKERKLQVLALAPLDIYLKNKDYALIKAILEKEGLSEVILEFEPLFHDKASTDNERPG